MPAKYYLDITSELKIEIQKWIDALRSGNYSQGKKSLQNADGFCCLGVACAVLIEKEKLLLDAGGYIRGNYPATQPESPDWLNKINEDFKMRTGISLSVLNDSYHLNFSDIADALERVYIKELSYNLYEKLN